jgi:FlaA1/EpsC-like NDP-sugar epimerase
MTRKHIEGDWSTFLGRLPARVDQRLRESVSRDKCVLVTGAGGSIGSRLVGAVIAGQARKVILFDLSESGLYECCRAVSAHADSTRTEIVPVVGSVHDLTLLSYLLKAHQLDLILHAAAYKHVPLMEQNPFTAVANNALGTYRLAAAAVESGVSQMVMVSTDKAVNPQSIMGASKRIAELAVLSLSSESMRMNAVRLGNVLGSSGSVVPLFRGQVDYGLPLTVTDKEATRYFLTPEEADVAILEAADNGVWGRVLVPNCGEPIRIENLARYIAAQSGVEPKIEYIGLRPGDKFHEELVAEAEIVESETGGGLRIVRSPAPHEGILASAMARVDEAIARFDLLLLMALVTELVPTYKPSPSLLQGIAAAEVR